MLTAASGKGDLDEGLRLGMQELGGSSQRPMPVNRHPAVISMQGRNSTAREVIGWHLVFRPLPRMMQTGNDPLRILRELASR